MSDTLLLSIYTPSRTWIEKQPVSKLVLSSLEGEIEILPEHGFFLGGLETGRFLFQKVGSEKIEEGVMTTGFFEVDRNHVRVIADILERNEDIDLKRAQKAQKRAEEKLALGSSLDEVEKYRLKLFRALIRQQQARKKTHAG